MRREELDGEVARLLESRQACAKELADWVAKSESVRHALSEARASLSLAPADTGGQLGAETYSAFHSAEEALDVQVGELLALQPRFQRTSLSLGMLGQSGMGKSRLLRSLTGLSAQEIPDAKGAAKTGVTSIIRQGSPHTAVVHFLNRREYFARILPYFRPLGLTQPSSLEQFWSNPLDQPLKADETYEHLKAHYVARAQIGALLDSPPRTIPSGEIVQYVAQRDPAGQPLGAFLAVDRLELTTEFPSQIAGVSVIDLPGMGETNLTHEPLVVEAIRDEVDVLVVLKRPEEVRYFWGEDEKRLKELAIRALPEVPMNLRSVMVLNRYVADGRNNSAAVSELLDGLTPEIFDASFAAAVDASSTSEVGELYRRILEELLPRLQQADEQLIQRRRAAWAEVAMSVQYCVNVGKRALGDSASINPMWRHDHATAALTDLQLALAPFREAAAVDESAIRSDLEARFAEAQRLAREIVDGISHQAFIVQRARSKGSNAIAYGVLLDEQRARLLRHYANLGPVLNDFLEDTKTSIATALLQGGHLERLVSSQGEPALQEIRNLLDDPELGIPPDAPVIAALDFLIRAKLDYRALIGHHIQDALRNLSSSSPWAEISDMTEGARAGVPRPVNPILWDTNRVGTQLLTDAIRGAGHHVLYASLEASEEDMGASAALKPGGVQGVLGRSIERPGREISAIVTQFVVMALDSEHAEDEWRVLYQRYSAQIWAEEFAQITAKSDALRKVDDALNQLSRQNRELENMVAAGVRDE